MVLVVQRALEALAVEDEAGVGDAVVAGSAAKTSSAPAICGTSFGWTKLAASIRLRPAAAIRVHSSARTAGSRITLSFCRPSRGPTSHTLISAHPWIPSRACID